MYVSESLCCTAEINTPLCINYISIKFKKKEFIKLRYFSLRNFSQFEVKRFHVEFDLRKLSKTSIVLTI